jgi:CHAD domain-containing protein
LQTLLEHIVSERDRNQKKLIKMLDRVRRRAGKVRDLDAQLAALRSLKVQQEPRRKTQLMHRLIELRARHEKKLRNLLDRKTIAEIRKRLKRSAKKLNLEGSRDPLTVARTMVGELTRPAGPLSEELLHHYRTIVKRARYAAEFAPKSAEAARFAAQLRRLQDAVGPWHDWLTLTRTATKQLGDVNQSSLVAVLHNVVGGKFRQAVAGLSTSPAIQITSRPAPTASEQLRKVSMKGPTLVTPTETAA